MPHPHRILVLAILAALPASLFANPTYNITRPGLTGPGYTQTPDFSSATPAALNDSNQVIGTSLRFSGPTFLGQSAWLYDFSTSSNTQLGFTTGLYSGGPGTQSSTPLFLNPSGQVAGVSSRYSPIGDQIGQSAWFYDFSTNTLQQIGLTDAPHTAPNFTQNSTPVQLFSSRFAVGNSDVYSTDPLNNTAIASTAWVYDRTTNLTTAIGLTGPTYTETFGLQSSTSLPATTALNFFAIGFSQRFTANTPSGQDAWLYSPSAGTIPIGYTNPMYDTSAPIGISNSAIVIGNSHRIFGTTDAWRYTIATATLEPLGLTDAAHTSLLGTTSSNAADLNESGDAIGTSVQYVQGLPLGQSAWVQYHNSSTAIQVGLIGALYENFGAHASTPLKISANGIVAGTTARFDNPGNGDAAWAYDPNSITPHTSRIGLFGGPYTSGGVEDSSIVALNSTGQIIGTSTRFDSNGSNPTGWFYDPATQTTTPISGPGIFYTIPEFIGDDGVVLGTYTLFDGSGNPLGTDAFYWTLPTGAVTLGTLVNNGLAANDWQFLYDTFARNSSGSITGTGLATDQSPDSTATYLLTLPPPAVPEPASLALLSLGLLALPRRRLAQRRN